MSWRTLLPVRIGGCPAAWELSRTLLEEGRRDVTAHLAACERCGAERRSLARANASIRALPRPAMSQEAFELIEARLGFGVVAPASPPSPRTEAHGWAKRAAAISVSCGLVAAASLLLARHVRNVERSPDPRASLASIRAVGDTVFSRESAADEVVRLESGTLELDVGSTPPERRFRVLTDDAVIESAESRISVQAAARTLVAVRVFAGYADVRLRGGHALLRAGDEWVQRATLVPAEVEPATPRRVGGGAARSGSFERAWHLLDAGKAAQAAEAFRAVEARSPGDAIVEDAVFWRGVSLVRAARPGEARAVLLRFTSRFPHSERVGEASAMLGWILLEAGDTDGARRAFERAQNDKVDRVRASARSGIARIGR
jgi:hypothetical protein